MLKNSGVSNKHFGGQGLAQEYAISKWNMQTQLNFSLINEVTKSKFVLLLC